MKIDLHFKTLTGQKASFRLESDDRKKLKEFSHKDLPNQDRLHVKSELKLEDPEYGSEFSIKTER